MAGGAEPPSADGQCGPACPLAWAVQSWTQWGLRPQGQMVLAEQGAAWLSTALRGKVGRGSWPTSVPPQSSPKAPGPRDGPREAGLGRAASVLVLLCPAAESGCWPVRDWVRGTAGARVSPRVGGLHASPPAFRLRPPSQLPPASSQGPLRNTCCPVGPDSTDAPEPHAPTPWP